MDQNAKNAWILKALATPSRTMEDTAGPHRKGSMRTGEDTAGPNRKGEMDTMEPGRNPFDDPDAVAAAAATFPQPGYLEFVEKASKSRPK